MTRVRTNDDQNDKDDNIDCDQNSGRWRSLRCRVLRRRHGESISGYDWLSVRYPVWLMTAAAITDHDNKEHTILSTLHMSQHLLYVIINYLWTGFRKNFKVRAKEKHETYQEEKAIFELKEFYFYYNSIRDTNSVSKRICSNSFHCSCLIHFFAMHGAWLFMMSVDQCTLVLMWAPLSVCCVCNIDGLVDKTLMDYTIIARNTRPRERETRSSLLWPSQQL